MDNPYRRGSEWRRWDLHFHTPSSFDYENKSVTNRQLVDTLIENDVRVVAVTDHHVIDVDRIKEMQELGKDKLTVLPGIELRSDQGGDPIHYICIFPENCDLRDVWTTLQGSLRLTPAAIKEMGGDDKIYVPMEKGAKQARNLGGVVSIHAGGKSNSIEGIKNTEQFQQRIKYDITRKWVDLMEVGQIRDIDVHLKKIFPTTGLNKPLIICSDNHLITDYSIKAPLWFRCDPSFRGLLMILREPQGRVSIESRPSEPIRVEQNPTKYIKRVSFKRKETAPATEKWFNGDVLFSPGLVAIIGNKGSGKSALSDTLGLLGASKNSEAFSFLNKKKFKHPVAGQASHFDATIEWESGETTTLCLNDPVLPEGVERLKYLPQDHVETVCNELDRTGEHSFEQELKTVIFSHVPETQKLEQISLDDLVRFQTNEKQKRIDSLYKQLREINRARAGLEINSDPKVRKEIEEKIERRKLEIEAHDSVKPAEMVNPSIGENGQTPDPSLMKDLADAEGEVKAAEKSISEAKESQRIAERRHAVAKRLIEKLDNFRKEFDVLETSLIEETSELGLDTSDLISLTIDKSRVEGVQKEAKRLIDDAKTNLDEGNAAGLPNLLETKQNVLNEIQAKLDAPNRAYQAYLKSLASWQEKRKTLEGNENEPESLKGLKSAIVAFDSLPEKIVKLQEKQIQISREILTEKISQVKVYRTLYEPVQKFIDSHVLAKGKLRLEFRAELTNQGFQERFLELLALNKRGSFMGIDEGRTRVESFTQVVNWEDAKSMDQFLTAVDRALHEDQREKPAPAMQLQDQVLKRTKIENVFDLLYGLEYIEPRYILRWDGKDLSMLSPGERGTLLLVFYLLIDKGDMPLIIDQPEGNLDNHTVAKVLVDCIREARKRRQVFLVTHNPNLAVVCDADQVIHASINKADGNKITYTSGALENPSMSQFVTDVLEGTRWAFGVRDAKYKVVE